jgi:hypothetical protein
MYCRRIFDHANRLTEESAVATVALYLVIQAYRATAATARLALAGYADIAAGLSRSVWEIQLRLARTRRGGELAAVADLYMSVNHEIKLREAGIAQDGDEEDRRVLDTWIAGREELVSKAKALGSNESELRKIGLASVAVLAKEEDLQSEYDIWYKALSQMHHGARAFTTYHYMLDSVPEGGSILLPVDDDIETMICISLEHLYRAMTQSALLFDDSALASDVDRTHRSLATLIQKTLGDGAA